VVSTYPSEKYDESSVGMIFHSQWKKQFQTTSQKINYPPRGAFRSLTTGGSSHFLRSLNRPVVDELLNGILWDFIRFYGITMGFNVITLW